MGVTSHINRIDHPLVLKENQEQEEGEGEEEKEEEEEEDEEENEIKKREGMSWERLWSPWEPPGKP